MRAHAKGARAEREVAVQITALTGWPIRRRLQEGRADDAGDLEGLPLITAQVKDYTDPCRALREAIPQVAMQSARAGTIAGVALIRFRGGRWIAAMSIPDLCRLLQTADHEATDTII